MVLSLLRSSATRRNIIAPLANNVRYWSTSSSLSDVDVTKLKVIKTKAPRAKKPKEELTFGSTFTDHMLEIDWDNKKGWHAPIIKPYGNISLDPAASVLHYALECFEGMKAYVDKDKNIRLFRPDLNMKRMNASMERLFLPTFDSDAVIHLIKELLRLDRDWIPEGEGYSMYIRPTGISTHQYIGVGPSASAKLFVILSPVGPYYPEGFNPVKLYADDKYVRAWPGGTGNTKIGGNYCSTILPQVEGAKKGYSQVLWLFGQDHFITEVGTMNLFVFWINEKGEKELVTPPLDRGDILPGITRQSILELCKKWGDFKVSEKNVRMPSVAKAIKEGRIIEVFGSGTAAVISPVSTIHYKGEDLAIPLNAPGGKSGELAQRIWDSIIDIQYARVESPWSIVV